jgi:hypothetical protein
LFERAHHVRIATILEALDADWLREHGCLFGGGTAIALSRGEYRESLDIDFLVSNREGYRALRQRVTSDDGLSGITRAGLRLRSRSGVRADQYGVRTMVEVQGASIKVEFVAEARVELEAPGPKDRVCGVSTLTTLDMATIKLLANSDRWADDAVSSRDLIDLAMLEPPRPVLKQALAKATTAYGAAVERDLTRAISRLVERPGRLEHCMTALKMDGVPRALLWKRIKRLRPTPKRS